MKKCLDENEIAQYSDYLTNFDTVEPSIKILFHVMNCEFCKMKFLK